MSKQISDFIKGKVIALRDLNMTYKKISEELKIPESTVGDICRRYYKEGRFKRKQGSGRQTVLTETDCNIILRRIKKTRLHHQKIWQIIWNTVLAHEP